MEKYGVVIEDEKVKTSSKDNLCPKCGKPLPAAQFEPDSEGNVRPPWYCPNCGTEPFEAHPK